MPSEPLLQTVERTIEVQKSLGRRTDPGRSFGERQAKHACPASLICQMGARMIDAAEAKRLTPGNEQDWIGGVVSPRDGRA